MTQLTLAALCLAALLDKTLNASVSNATKVAEALQWDARAVRKDLESFSAEPHPFGSTAQHERSLWLQSETKALGRDSDAQTFTSQVPNPLLLTIKAKSQSSKGTGGDTKVPLTLNRHGENIIVAAQLSKQASCYVAVGSHYDTKHSDEFRYLGANDSGSSSILLLKLLAYLKTRSSDLTGLRCEILFVWFDGEEAVLPDWNAGKEKHPAHLTDNTYGSRYFVSNLKSCLFEGQKALCLPDLPHARSKPLISLILLDMIGSRELRLSNDSFSSPVLRSQLQKALKAHQLEKHFVPHEQAIADDHLPFLQARISAINLIDFNDLHSWHQQGDVASQVSVDSMRIAGILALDLALSVAANPQIFFQPAD